MAAAEQAFRSTTIADVTADPSRRPLRERKADLTISGGRASVATKRKKRK